MGVVVEIHFFYLLCIFEHIDYDMYKMHLNIFQLKKIGIKYICLIILKVNKKHFQIPKV